MYKGTLGRLRQTCAVYASDFPQKAAEVCAPAFASPFRQEAIIWKRSAYSNTYPLLRVTSLY